MSVQEYGSQPRIVAGVDGSDSSLSALRWAVRQAGLTGAAVDAVAAWHYPVAAGGFGYVPMGTGEDYDFKEITEKALADAISSTVDPGSDVRVRGHVIEGNAAQVLLDASDGADQDRHQYEQRVDADRAAHHDRVQHVVLELCVDEEDDQGDDAGGQGVAGLELH